MAMNFGGLLHKHDEESPQRRYSVEVVGKGDSVIKKLDYDSMDRALGRYVFSKESAGKEFQVRLKDNRTGDFILR